MWRWIGTHAPDVVVFTGGDSRPDGLAAQLPRTAPAGTGTIPVVRVRAANGGFLKNFLAAWRGGPSPARLEMQRRLSRTPAEVARQLSAKYGHELSEAVYIPAVALIGRLRLGALADVESITAPYFDGRRNSLEKATSSHLSGHLVFGELAKLTGKARYVDLVRAAADLGFDAQGRPKESMPMHNEMSDSLFMGCPILAQAGALAKDAKYFDMCVRHMRFMQKLTLRKDGIYRHSPLDEAAWGRGNGFPALGLALSLAEMPQDHPGRAEMLASFRAHMAALLAHQHATGMWRQVIDFDGSYPELTATCMIAFAMSRGIRSGWLEKDKYSPAVERAWYGVRARVAADGGLIDVCTGTGKQPNLKAYLDRTAILGPDPRGGAMALLLATELMGAGR
jgi:rhamnogalacturonyl hydrolase YesR